jgi:hypothetical protein
MRYTQVIDGEWIEPDSDEHRIACCDCGLVHVMYFRVKRKRVQFMAYRDVKATNARRKRLGIGSRKSR